MVINESKTEYNKYKNRIEKAHNRGDLESIKRDKEAIMYAPAARLSNSEARELFDLCKRYLNESDSNSKLVRIGWTRKPLSDIIHLVQHDKYILHVDSSSGTKRYSIHHPDGMTSFDIDKSTFDELKKYVDKSRIVNESKLNESSQVSQSDIKKFINTPAEELESKFVTDLISGYIYEFSNIFPKDADEWDKLDNKYNSVKGEFYKKWFDFVKKCEDILDSHKFHSTGYGKDAFMKIKLEEKLRYISNTFPYGWKMFKR